MKHHMHQAAWWLQLLTLAFWLLVEPRLPAQSPPSEGEVRMEEFIRRFETDWRGLSRFYDLPWSQARASRMEKLYGDWQGKLTGLKFDALGQPGRIDYLLIRNKITSELNRLSLERRRLGEMDELLSFRAPIQDLERARWRMEPVDAPAAATKIAALPDLIKKLRGRIDKGKKAKDKSKEAKAATDPDKPAPDETVAKEKPDDSKESVAPLKVSPIVAKRASAAAGEIRGTLKNWFTFYDGYQPDFSWWLKKPYEDAAKSLEEYAKYLREDIAELKGKDEDPLLGEAIGADALAEDLAGEMIPYTAEELIAIGEKEFAWCEGEMKKAAQEMGLGEDWKAALDRVKSHYVPPGQQDEFIAEQAHAAISFVKEHQLVSLPPLCEETWRLSMVSPEGQKTLPYAAYSGQNMLVAYAKDEMKHEDKLMSMRGNNRHFTRIVTAHELIPGHHLQGFMAARERPYRSLFSTPFLVEGWSLYWELRLWDLNYARSPEDRIGMLFWRMHRCARIIVSLKFHLGRMKPAEMVTFLTDRVGHEKLGATSEVRRFIGGDYSPLYQCGYMIGGMQLHALRQEAVGAGKMTDQQFNDAVLTMGPIPVEMIRAGILNTPLARNAQASWKFAQ